MRKENLRRNGAPPLVRGGRRLCGLHRLCVSPAAASVGRDPPFLPRLANGATFHAQFQQMRQQ